MACRTLSGSSSSGCNQIASAVPHRHLTADLSGSEKAIVEVERFAHSRRVAIPVNKHDRAHSGKPGHLDRLLRKLESDGPDVTAKKIAGALMIPDNGCFGQDGDRIRAALRDRLPTRSDVINMMQSLRKASQRLKMDNHIAQGESEFNFDIPRVRSTPSQDSPSVFSPMKAADPRIVRREAVGGRYAADRSTSSTSEGAFSLSFGSYASPTSSSSKDETLSYVWCPYYSSNAKLSYVELHSMIREWKAIDDPGDFLFWTTGWGGAHRAFLHALRLLDVYRGNITNSNDNCPCARDAFSARFNAMNYKIHIDNIGGCVTTSDNITFEHGTAFPVSISHTGNAGTYDSFNKTIHPCANLVSGQGKVVDALLAFAHRAFWYAIEGDIDHPKSVSYFYQAQMLGRLALGAVAMLSRTTLHEMMHREFGLGHCSHGCCMQRIALRFQCRTFASLGLFTAETDSGIDTFLSGYLVSYNSECKNPIFGPPEAFDGYCYMNHPGRQGAASDWSGESSWSNPSGCL
jgi:hypothetical protein